MTCLLISTFKALMIIFVRIFGLYFSTLPSFPRCWMSDFCSICTSIFLHPLIQFLWKILVGVLSFRDSGKEMEGAEGFYQASFAKKYGMSLYLFSVMPNLSISFFSPLKQRHAGKIFVFFMYPPLALAQLKGKRTRFRRNKMELWRTVELLQMDLLCSVASPCWFQMYCQI